MGLEPNRHIDTSGLSECTVYLCVRKGEQYKTIFKYSLVHFLSTDMKKVVIIEINFHVLSKHIFLIAMIEW